MLTPEEYLKRLQEIAISRNGVLLSTIYINSATKYHWKCKEGHEWWARANDICRGKWCPYCAGCAPKDLDYIKNLAIQKGGECLSTEYINNGTKYLWRCKEGHEWRAASRDVASGYWCPHCAGCAPKDLDYIKNLAIQKGGECLSTEYINNKTKYLWRCKEGHEWGASSHSVSSGYWCPKCKKKTQNRIYESLKKIFENTTWEHRFKWLGLQSLDIFIPELNTAIEYDGPQHYTFPNFFHKTEKDFQKGRSLDIKKQKLCQQHGIRIIRIREDFYQEVGHDKSIEWLLEQIKSPEVTGA